jgi:cold shock CspA family protein
LLKARKKFVGRRDRVVEGGGSTPQPSSFDIPMQSGKPQSEASAEDPVRGRVKWFNPIKGYRFVVLSDGRGDVFLHASALAGIGITTLRPGETLEFRITLGQRGPQLIEVISVDSSIAAPRRPLRKSFESQSSDPQPLEASRNGAVKWYNPLRISVSSLGTAAVRISSSMPPRLSRRASRV